MLCSIRKNFILKYRRSDSGLSSLGTKSPFVYQFPINFLKYFLDGYASFLIMHPPSSRLTILNSSPCPQDNISLIQTSSCCHPCSLFRLQTLLGQLWPPYKPMYHQQFATSSAGKKKLLKHPVTHTMEVLLDWCITVV